MGALPRRRELSTALVVLAACTLLLAVIAGYAKRTLLDADQLANRATATLRDDTHHE